MRHVTHRRSSPAGVANAAPNRTSSDEEILRQVGPWLDSKLAKPRFKSAFLKRRARHLEAWAVYHRSLAAYDERCEAAVLRVLDRGLLLEPIPEDEIDDRGMFEVMGWFPMSCVHIFEEQDGRKAGRGSILRKPPRTQAKTAKIAAAAAAVLRSKDLRDSSRDLDAAGTHFWARVRAHCNLPPRPRSPRGVEALAGQPLEAQLAFACAKLLAIRDAVSSFPFLADTTDRSGPVTFGADMRHHALRPYVIADGERRWLPEGRLAQELQRLVERELLTGGASESTKLTDNEERVWNTLAGCRLKSPDIAKILNTHDVEVRQCISRIRIKKDDKHCITLGDGPGCVIGSKHGFWRPDSPPPAPS